MEVFFSMFFLFKDISMVFLFLLSLLGWMRVKGPRCLDVHLVSFFWSRLGVGQKPRFFGCSMMFTGGFLGTYSVDSLFLCCLSA